VHNYTPSGRITARIMDEVRKVRLTEQVSYWNALEKYRSEFREVRSVRSLNRFRGKFQRRIIDGLSKELQIVKIRNKYMCNKQRVDAMDFKLWFFADRPYYETWNFCARVSNISRTKAVDYWAPCSFPLLVLSHSSEVELRPLKMQWRGASLHLSIL